MDRRRSLIRGTLACLIVITVVSLCSSWLNTVTLDGRWRRSDPQPAPDPGPRVVRISPSELFPGDLKRVGPHLGLMASGCVHFDVTGSDDLFIGTEVELWQKGKKPRSFGAGSTRHKGSGELSVSLRELPEPHGRRMSQLVTAITGPSGSGSHTRQVELPEPGMGVPTGMTRQLAESRELAAGERAAVWTHVVPEDVRQTPVDGSLEAEVQASQWAIVLWTWWEEAKSR